MNETELIAAYVGVLRHELKLPRGADPLLELELKLVPADPLQRPPTRAPGIARLRKALKRLKARKHPVDSLDKFAEDLRFLRVFDDDTSAWSSDALEDLLANVITAPSPRATKTADPADASAPIPLRPRRPRSGA